MSFALLHQRRANASKVLVLLNNLDNLNNELGINKDRYKSLADEMDSTFAELAGY
ncbi:hypothetical protein MSG28_012222 [Choristoneura fumiferana]|uniref:Uncharacterized protein n=1 Tax=Choristoneura fumiferana TaxID=7141 RepID=A0ACC0KC92_CHOFU|nr:hypothetical protein MSG28_012222 [Choristoneura fumiferana]